MCLPYCLLLADHISLCQAYGRLRFNVDLKEETATLHTLNLREVPDYELDLPDPATLEYETHHSYRVWD